MGTNQKVVIGRTVYNIVGGLSAEDQARDYPEYHAFSPKNEWHLEGPKGGIKVLWQSTRTENAPFELTPFARGRTWGRGRVLSPEDVTFTGGHAE